MKNLYCASAALALALALAACKPAGDATPSGVAASTTAAAAQPTAPAGAASDDPGTATSAPAAAIPVENGNDVAARVAPPLTMPPAATGSFRIVSILLGRTLDAEHVVIGDSAVFAPRDAIHASVLSVGASQGLRISARWLGPDGSTIAETSQPLVPTSPTATTFTISSSKPWPGGEYQMIVAVNGDALQARKFQVR